MNEKKITRRSFLKGTLLTVGAAIASPILSQVAPLTLRDPSQNTKPSEFMQRSASQVNYGPSYGVAKLNANENPYGPSPAALNAMNKAIQKGSYYVTAVTKLKEMIAEKNNVTPDHILIGSGSSAPLQWLATKVTRKGHILGPDLFWDTTSIMGSKNNQFTLERLPKSSDLSINLDDMEKFVTPNTALIQITNPNNPTGLTISPTKLKEFCKKLSKKVLVLVDEAYNELTPQPEKNTMVPLVRKGFDVVVARTFSKIYGLAGMRVGYIIAKPELIEKIASFGLGDYSLNQAGVAGAIASYNDEVFLKFSKQKIIEAREIIEEAVKVNGLQSLSSTTNFVFVNLGDLNAESFRKEMAKENVLVRGIYRDYSHWSRVSTGKIEDVIQYANALPRVLEKIA